MQHTANQLPLVRKSTGSLRKALCKGTKFTRITYSNLPDQTLEIQRELSWFSYKIECSEALIRISLRIQFLKKKKGGGREKDPIALLWNYMWWEEHGQWMKMSANRRKFPFRWDRLVGLLRYWEVNLEVWVIKIHQIIFGDSNQNVTVQSFRRRAKGIKAYPYNLYAHKVV